MIYLSTSNSSHPLSTAISNALESYSNDESPDYFEEMTGKGIMANFNEVSLKIGSLEWVGIPPTELEKAGSHVHIQINEAYYGYFHIENSLRSGLEEMLLRLNEKFKVFVLSGDRDKDKNKLINIGLNPSQLYFEQNPHDKLNFIKTLQDNGKSVLMVGDGLNDSGALRQSNLGIAVTNESHTFTPASDIIMQGDKLSLLPDVIGLTGFARNVIIASFIFSFLYNIIGIVLALSGNLAPIHAAILMPLSSITVLILATFLIRFYAYRNKLIRI